MWLGSYARLLLIAVFMLVAPGGPVCGGERDLAGWSQRRAGEYLDGRAQEWFEYGAADRGEGSHKISCISCHTLLPFALARPVLRKLSGVDQPTSYETAILHQVKMRVANWDALDAKPFALFYDFNAQKKKEARGTEAILNALVLALDDTNEGRKGPGPSTHQAFANLWKTQLGTGNDKGSWDWLDFGLEPWEAKQGRYFGAALAALAVGPQGCHPSSVPAETEVKIQLMRGYLRGRLAEQNLFNQLWMLWASTRFEGLLTEAEQQKLLTTVFEKQQADGGWSLPSLGKFTRKDNTPQATDSDGYATGLVLHVAQVAGLSKGDARLSKGLHWLRMHQTATGAWTCVSVNKKRPAATMIGKFMSDSATGFAILALSH